MSESVSSSFSLSEAEFDAVLQAWGRSADIVAPCRFPARGRMSGQDVIRYAAVNCSAQIAWQEKSDFSPKEVLFPPNETLFHLVGDALHEAPGAPDGDRPLLLFCRACDIHGIDRLDRIFLENGAAADPYYRRRRQRLRLVLMECSRSMENCFCVSMGTNRVEAYSLAVRFGPSAAVELEVRDAGLLEAIPASARRSGFTPRFVEEDDSPVQLPEPAALTREIVENDLFDHPLWEPYSRRCIACGRCNFSCPTCSCFSSVDAVCDHAPELGVRRRVWAGCHVDRFTQMAGRHDVRTDYGSRMRFKTMHKIYDFQQRFGVHMCVGCGRCDDQCPEYISFSTCINRVNDLVAANGED